HQHWVENTGGMLQTSRHLLWSDHLNTPKLFSLDAPIPLSELLLKLDRRAVEVHPAIKLIAELPQRYRLRQAFSSEKSLPKIERCMLPYLQTGADLHFLMAEPDLDRITCYRALFVLWISGELSADPPKTMAVQEKQSNWVFRKIREIPPVWIFPFVAGLLVGPFLAPAPEPRADHRLEREKNVRQ